MNLGCVSGRRTLAISAICGIFATVAVALPSPAEAARRKKAAGGGYNPPYAAMVVDAKTGRVLHAENEDALRHPASVTKVMTLYLLFEQLERGKLSLDSRLQVSANAAAQAPSKLGLRAGSSIAVEDVIKALVTKSANDAAVVIAENLAVSEDAFAEQMTRRARSLGMSRTTFRNASGLPNPEQVTTARDLTTLARAIQDRFPKYYSYFQTRVFEFGGARYANHNKLLGRVEGVDGIKTGFTRASGFNLMTNARTETRHIVAVVLGGRSGPSRDRIMASLVESNLPKAYAGARTAPLVGEGPRPVAVADAASRRDLNVETTAATSPSRAAAEPRKPLDLNSLRPVVASAAGATSTTTPVSKPLRWKAGAQPLPLSAHAYAAVEDSEPATRPVGSTGKFDDRLPAPPPPAPPSPAAPQAKREAPRATPSGWVIQLGATDDEDKAKAILESARSRLGRALTGVEPFTEKVSKSGTTLFRARFSGFEGADEAQKACKALKRSGFACFATRS
ncbi:serine hydrolase [Microvirga massiliensis]|uniref:serine hydrolase n=1 Tax=Microvirga massiliensis TaxID=1033741 RepID=UPI0009E57E8A|nr:serine hydrolase [Microvirga massiliensis]